MNEKISPWRRARAAWDVLRGRAVIHAIEEAEIVFRSKPVRDIVNSDSVLNVTFPAGTEIDLLDGRTLTILGAGEGEQVTIGQGRAEIIRWNGEAKEPA